MSATATASQILRIAQKEIGVKEGWDSKNGWNNRVKYNDWYATHPKIKNEAFRATAWCAVFVSWVANQAGVLGTLIPMHAWTPSGLAWFQSRNLVTKGYGAKPGDIVYFYYASMGRVAHVGVVERIEGNYIYTIEGNTNTTGARQGNGVYRLKRKIASTMYFCHPQYSTTATPLPNKNPSNPTHSQVSLSGLINAALTDPPKPNQNTTNWGAVLPVEEALAKEALLARKYVDGHFGTITVSAYSQWQKKLGYRGKDADGIPGRASLVALGNKHGFSVVN